MNKSSDTKKLREPTESTASERQADGESSKKFLPNNQYFTISIYVLIVVAVSTLIIRVVMTPHAVTNALKDVLNILMPFLMGILIAFILNPLVKKLILLFNGPCKIKSKRACKALAIILSYLIILGVITLCIFYIVPQVVISLTEVINGLPKLYQMTYDFFDNLQERFPNADVSEIQSIVNDVLPDLINSLKNFASDLVPAVYAASISIVKGLLNFIIAIIVSVYMLVDKKGLQRSMKKVLYSFVPVKRIDTTMNILSECNHIFTNFIVGKAIDSTIIGVLCFVLMSIFKMPYALLISIIVGITNMIPYFGPFIGAVPGVVVLLMVSPLTSLGFAVLILILQQFDGLYLGPKILGDTVGLKPLWIIISITLGGSIAGVLGMFLSVPVVAVLRYLLGLYLDYRLEKRHIVLKSDAR
ncbi:MAG: AI-2E family transporter [Eubacteriales bacterium]|nr:AI-2E family transporter [Eubacteriales bacterium]